MNLRLINKSLLLLILSVLISAAIMIIPGCSDDNGTNPPPGGTDTSKVIVHKGVQAFYWFQGPNDTTHMGVDLWQGQYTIQVSTRKDMELTIVPPYDTTNFFFRSGDLSQILAGFKTRFYRIYANARDTAFDTLTVIPDSDNNLDSLDFTSDDTYASGAWSYFVIDQPQKPIYSFYLAGKYADGTTGSHRVYGVFQIKSVLKVFAVYFPPATGVMITLDIKYNKDGVNYFKH